MSGGTLLHLGMHKAGSSAIQAACRGFRDGRTRYADLPAANHSRLMALAFRDDPPDRTFRGEGAPDEERAAARAAVAGALAAAGGERVIFSGEGLSAFPDEAACARVVAALEGHGPVHGLAYVRDPAGYLRSAFQQVIRAAVATLEERRAFYHYRRRLEPWERALARHRLDLVPFERAAFAGGDLIADFAGRAGIDAARLHPPGEGANPSLPGEAVAVLTAWRHGAPLPDVRGRAKRANLALVRLLRGFGTTPFAVDPALARRAAEAHAAEVAWIEARLGRPFPPPPAPEGRAVGSTAELIAWGRDLAPDLRAFLAAHGLPAAAGETPALLGAALAATGEGLERGRARR